MLPMIPEPHFDKPVQEYLLAREYRGNVRDLQQIVARMAYRHAGTGVITIGDIAPEDRREYSLPAQWQDGPFRKAVQRAVCLGVGLKAIGRAAEDVAEELALEQESGNLQQAARRLGVTDRALQLRRQIRRAGTPEGHVTPGRVQFDGTADRIRR